MKTSALDFFMAIGVMLMILIISLNLTGAFVAPLTRSSLGDYHVVADVLSFLLCYGILSGLVMRLILMFKPFVPGDYSMDDSQFTIWKLYSIVYSFGRGALLPFTTVFTKPLIPKLFGAKLGQRVALGGGIADAPLVTVGERSVLGHNSSVIAHMITSGRITLKEVNIGSGVTVGVNAIIWPGAEIGDGAIVAAGSVVPPDTKIPPNELWAGAPARKVKVVDADDPRG